jgi:transcriptional regulator with XRE-family HTH domain
MMAAPGGGGAAGGEEAEEQTEFDVMLTGAGDKKIQVIKEVRALTSLGLKEAKDLVDSAPKPVLERVNREAADKAKEQLEGAGATVRPGRDLRASEGLPVADGSRFGGNRRAKIGNEMGEERTFGQRLRAARKKAGYSQSDLEEISGIPKARLSRYENGHVAPSIQTLERLARALEVSEASLLGDDRALMEEFFGVLTARGVRLGSSEQAVALGSAVADIARALGMVEGAGGADDLVEVGSIDTGAVAAAATGWSTSGS